MKASYKQEPKALAMNITTLYHCVTCSKAPLCYGGELLIRTIPHLFPVGTHTHTSQTYFFLTFRLSLPYLKKKMSQEIGTLAYG